MTTKTNDEEVTEFIPAMPTAKDELVVTDSQAAETDIKTALDVVDGVRPAKTPDEVMMGKLREIDLDSTGNIAEDTTVDKVKSDGSTASYYELPSDATELQHLIAFKNMNAQMGEIFRANYRYGEVSHSEKLRDAKKIKYYIEAEIERLEKYEK